MTKDALHSEFRRRHFPHESSEFLLWPAVPWELATGTGVETNDWAVYFVWNRMAFEICNLIWWTELVGKTVSQKSNSEIVQSGVLVCCVSGGCPVHDMFCGKTSSRSLKVLIHKSSTTEVDFESSVVHIKLYYNQPPIVENTYCWFLVILEIVMISTLLVVDMATYFGVFQDVFTIWNSYS